LEHEGRQQSQNRDAQPWVPEDVDALHPPATQPPAVQTIPLVAQSVPPAAYPEPAALHVVATVPLHVGWPGVHTRALHVATDVDESQYCVAVHVA
jgi:hypothetical protein